MRWLGWQPKKRATAYLEISLVPPLREAISAVAIIANAYILGGHGHPFITADTYRKSLRKRCDEAGLIGRPSHAIKKAIAELFAEEGCSEHQNISVLTHTKPNTSAIYTKGAERLAMASEAMNSISGFGW